MIYASIAGVGILQAVLPTVAGWAYMFLVFFVYAVLDIPGSGPLQVRAMVFLGVVALQAGAFWIMRPWKQWPGRTSAPTSREQDA
jgi:hypothetical protein